MEINIRSHVLGNLENSGFDEIEATIKDSIQEGEDVTLPGLGVLFEVLWNSSDSSKKSEIVSLIEKNLTN